MFFSCGKYDHKSNAYVDAKSFFFFLTNVNAKSLVMEEQHVVEDLKNYKWWLGLRPYQSGDIKEV